jgi:uncharacterized protein YkwD
MLGVSVRRTIRRVLPVLALAAVVLGSAGVAAAETSAEEQQFIYELNVARHDPSAYAGAHLSGDVADHVASLAPRPPLAVNDTLGASARFHSAEMAETPYFNHRSDATGEYTNQLIRRFGYPLPSWYPDEANNAESIAGGYSSFSAALEGFMGSDGHRRHLMAEDAFFLDHREIGVGFVEESGSPYGRYLTVHTAYREGGPATYLTGVVFSDQNGNGTMDLEEGLGGVSVSAAGTSVTTNPGGGWSIPAGPGSWQVSASGGALAGELVATVTVADANVWMVLNATDTYETLGSDPCPSGAACDAVGFVDGAGRWHRYERLASDAIVDAFFYGDPGDVAFMGDWNCDGVATPGLYRQSDGYVYLRNSNTQGVADVRFFFGDPGDVPLAGDFDGNGCDTVSLFRPGSNRVYVINELGSDDGGLGAADFDFLFGNPGDAPFVGDFDGDGIDSVGLYRRATGFVYFRDGLSSGVADFEFFYGDPGDVIVAGDWDGDGDDTVAVYRPGDGRFYVNLENAPGAADHTVTVGEDYVAAVIA